MYGGTMTSIDRLVEFEGSRRNRENKAMLFLESLELGKAWAIYTGEPVDKFEEKTIKDIVTKLVKYGSISDKQEAFIKRLLDQIDKRTGPVASFSTAPADRVPMGRRTVIGKVLSVKDKETRFGIQKKMTVAVMTGSSYKLYGTVPASISGVTVGAEVMFDAEISPSPSDPGFGFFSRPTGARILTAGEPVDTSAAPVAAPRKPFYRKPYRKVLPPVEDKYSGPVKSDPVYWDDPLAEPPVEDEPVDEPVWTMDHTPREVVGHAAIYLLKEAEAEGRYSEVTDPNSVLLQSVALLAGIQSEL